MMTLQPQVLLVEDDQEKVSWWRRFWRMDVVHNALIMGKGGKAWVVPMRNDEAEHAGGVYVGKVSARRWLPVSLPAGWVTPFPEGNPEPMTLTDPKGYTAADIAWMKGDYLTNVVHAATHQGGLFEKKSVLVFVAGVAMAVGAGVAYGLGKAGLI